jgi:translation initiation factor 3 subunit M
LGAEISAERSEKGIEDDLHKIIGVCDACFKDATNVAQIEEVLNGIVSMLALVTGEKSENLIVAFCEKLTKAPSNMIGLTCLKVLWSLYQSLDENSPMRFHVYYALVTLAGKTQQIETVYKDMDTLKSQFTDCPLTNEQMQKLLKLLHEQLRAGKRSEDASKVMIELLGTYTTENASQAREETHRCIVASLADPNTFLLDNLLQLKPVKFLEGELVHDLLKIFVSEKLEAYQKFYENHREFVHGLGLNHEANLVKMKLLTFMQLAETKQEIKFGEIQQHMQISEAEVEEFLIDLLKTKLVKAKIDQSNQVLFLPASL